MNRPAAEVLEALERACLVADKAINERRWDDCNTACIEQRKLTHELEHAFRQLPAPSRERELALFRIRRIMKFREGQLARVQRYHENVGKRLANFGRFRRMSRALGAPPPQASLLDAQR